MPPDRWWLELHRRRHVAPLMVALKGPRKKVLKVAPPVKAQQKRQPETREQQAGPQEQQPEPLEQPAELPEQHRELAVPA